MAAKWHYIPHRILPQEPPSDLPVVGYLDAESPEGEPAVAVLADNQRELNKALKVLGLKPTLARWVERKDHVLLQDAAPMKRSASGPIWPRLPEAEKALADYSKLVSPPSAESRRRAQQHLERDRRAAEEQQNALIDLFRQIDHRIEELAQLGRNGTPDRSDEIATIRKLGLVEWVGIEKNCILIDLAPIKPFGRYRLVIDLRTGQYRIQNEKPVLVDGTVYHHPHVMDGMGGCLGNMAITLATLAAKRDIPGLVVALIEFLRGFRPTQGGGYRHIYNAFVERNKTK